MATGRGAAIGVAPHSQSYPHPLSLSASFPSITTFSLSRRHSFSLSSTKEKKPRVNLLLGSAAEPTTTSSPSSSLQNDATFVSDTEFSLAKVSFGVIGLGVGCTLLSYGFGAYFNILPGSEWSALMLTYGFPLAIIGMALKYAELKPVPCLTYSDAQLLRENCATPILKQVRNDVIRYRYGDEQHLEEALKRIFQYGQATEEGKYCLALVFEAKALQLSDFEQRQAKFASFFGPGITAEVGKGEEEGLYEVKLISDTTL
ncbi:uncharacterized protein LOC18436986 isoform X3 [Amborella trichopoda]|uniref:uncharacterized protein LOC18436986 isoform X3 n=1 Tax=Amborella trichopoda TaxID=13333 RepID=UPI0005D33B73|nr:uncharacterized protein LOC18436986 isoform X3 [Amborella trichopoda]|eukprot:XP_011624429.1 uncharacterized protein LOC18436986 isoform X3 [Amborella trichopoda]